MLRAKKLLASILVVSIIAAGYFLPTLLSLTQDRHIESSKNTLEVAPIMLKSSVSSSLVQRLQIVGSGSQFDTGNYPLAYSEEEAKEIMLKELCRLTELYGLPIPLFDQGGWDLSNAEFTSVTPYLYTDPRIAPGVTVVAWSLSIGIDDCYIALQMDEASALLSSMYIYFPKGYNTENDYYLDLLFTYADAYCGYLGLFNLSEDDLRVERTTDTDYDALYLYSTMHDPDDESLSIPYLFSLDPYSFIIEPQYYPDFSQTPVDSAELVKP